LVISILFVAQMACNLPVRNTGQATALPAPNQTLSALFAFTPNPLNATSTATLPPVVTATLGQPAAPTATNTQVPPTATATNPPAPTSTFTRVPPQPTATIPGVRSRSPVIAKYLSTPPTLDGDWGEWKSLTTEYPAGNVVFGKSNWVDENDLDASFHVGWDNNYLYVAVKVRDDKYVQNATGENIFKGDSIEILLDTKLQDDFYYTKLSPDDFQLGINPGRPDPGGTKEAYLWFPNNIAGARPGVKIASRQENGVYRVEAAIPWSVFEMTPAAGRHYGFALSVSDNDNAGENLQQTMVSNVAVRHLTDPTSWGDLRLDK
ncbi:MAG: hypothetical protein IH586_17385, partial [Anaerolineaceae bacterium]|nr:hypothetical protein [Anaerolineaceae bacterium]